MNITIAVTKEEHEILEYLGGAKSVATALVKGRAAKAKGAYLNAVVGPEIAKGRDKIEAYDTLMIQEVERDDISRH